MIRILVSDIAYAAIASSLGETMLLTAQGSPQGGVFLWLDKVTVNQLAALRGSDESYSDVILRLAELEAAL
jgi:hypothetical protein